MEPVEGSRTFGVAATTYDSFMGRYSRPLSTEFADTAGVRRGQTAVDVGCGPGALTGTLVERLGAAAVAACDPSPGFVADCRDRHPGVRVEQGRAESIPFDDDAFDHALAQLVLHFVSDASAAAHEMARVVRPGGHVSACVWDFADGMEMLRAFWDAAAEIDPDAPDEARTLRFGRHGEIAELFEAAGLVDITESTLTVSSTYARFGELWEGFLAGVGPAGAHLLALPADRQRLLHDRLFERVGSPSAAFSLSAVARCVVARVPQ
jgi:SAM-dependent methyltransferase